MPPLSYGELTLVSIALILLARSTNPDSEIGKQLCELIGKVDEGLKDIRLQMENKTSDQ